MKREVESNHGLQNFEVRIDQGRHRNWLQRMVAVLLVRTMKDRFSWSTTDGFKRK